MEKKGQINISEEVIADIAGHAAVESYGVVGMTRRKLKDGIAELLGKENISKGIEVVLLDAGHVSIDLFLVVSFETKINEVAHNVMNKVKYSVENITGLSVQTVNINIQGVRVEEK